MHSYLFYLPVGLYFFALLYFSFFKNQLAHQQDENYYLANHNISPISAIFSVMATETSVATIMVFPAIGMSSHFSLMWLCLGYLTGRSLIAFYYLPKLYNQNSLSIYENITHNAPNAKNLLSGAYLVAKFISSGVRFFMAGFALNQLFGGSIFIWCCSTAVLVGLYSLRGGLKAVVQTDQIQAYIILFMGALLCFLLYPSEGLGSLDIQWINTQMRYDNALFFPAMFLGGIVVSIGSHGADQDLLQRVLATPSLKKAQRAMILSGVAATGVIFLYLCVGVFLGHRQMTLDAKSPLVSYISQLNQPFVLGLFAVLIFSAAMSTLDSAINSTALVWKSLFKQKKSNLFYSSLSLFCLLGFALSFILFQKFSESFLSLAMGSMNYVNGALIGILSLYILDSKKITYPGIASAFVFGFLSTYICTWSINPSLAWTWTIIVSSSVAFSTAYLSFLLFKKK